MTIRRAGPFSIPAASVAALALTAACSATPQSAPAPTPPSSSAPASSSAAGTATAVDTLTRGDLLPSSPPARLAIPALDVEVPVAGLGLAPDGSMEVPGDAATVGWYTGSPTPGALGPAVLAGHVDLKGSPGTFAELSTLAKGDKVTVTREDGTTATFTITSVDRYAKDRFPSEAVYGPIDHAGLRLITCGGAFDDKTGHYTDNVIAYAELA